MGKHRKSSSYSNKLVIVSISEVCPALDPTASIEKTVVTSGSWCLFLLFLLLLFFVLITCFSSVHLPFFRRMKAEQEESMELRQSRVG